MGLSKTADVLRCLKNFSNGPVSTLGQLTQLNSCQMVLGFC
jgi:hypothetical protein